METQTTLLDFQKKSLNNVLEICYILDSWIANLHMKKHLHVEISEMAKTALLNSLISLRRDIRNRNLKDLSDEPDKSYSIDIHEDMIVIGIQTFIEPIKLAEKCHKNNKINPPITDEELEFKPLFKYMLPFVNVNKWAELNNVAPNTVRQWINRQKIPAIKKDGAVVIPLLATTPENIIHNPNLTMTWNNIGYLPAAITNKHAYLREKNILLIMLIPRDDGNFNLHVNTIERKGKDTKTNSFDITLNNQERKNFVTIMNEKGYNSATERKYHAPLPSSEWKHTTRLPVINVKEFDNEIMKKFPAIGFIGKKEASSMNPIWETELYNADKNEKTIKISGSVLHNATSPGDALLTSIMSEEGFIQATRKIKDDSGWAIDNGWASDTLYATSITDINKTSNLTDEEIIEFFKTIAYRINMITRQKFFRIIIDIPEETDEKTKLLLNKAGYRCIPNTTTFYAYIVW